MSIFDFYSFSGSMVVVSGITVDGKGGLMYHLNGL